MKETPMTRDELSDAFRNNERVLVHHAWHTPTCSVARIVRLLLSGTRDTAMVLIEFDGGSRAWFNDGDIFKNPSGRASR
jgi:hypothetical protein